ncbi:MAG: stage II sporulation protein M [Rhodoferax sp.]|nr:stage II sporulation protein M [Actinomycetota bacterium]
MDLDVFVVTHRAQWARLDQLVARSNRRRPLSGAEADELVELYQQVATHLSRVQSSAPDPALVSRLSTLVARARAAVAGSTSPAWRDAGRFLTAGFPVVVLGAWRWWCGVATAFCLVSLSVGTWVATQPSVRASLATPEQIRALVETDFENYYSSNPAASFAAQVFTNNALIAAATLVLGVLLGIPVLVILFQNAVNVGIAGGLLAANGRADLFFGLIIPHGLLEITAVFVAGGIGLQLGWTLIDPGPRSRAQALAERGRAAVSAALGLALVLALSGVIEAFVTPSGLPTWARIAIGGAAETAFFSYVIVLGLRARRAGLTGDVDVSQRGDVLPVAG